MLWPHKRMALARETGERVPVIRDDVLVSCEGVLLCVREMTTNEMA